MAKPAGGQGWPASNRHDYEFLLLALGVLAAGLLLFSRAPGHLTDPELWAEDGRVWLQQAYQDGAKCLLRPEVGYLQTISRLTAFFTLAFPLRWAPLIFAAIAFVIQLMPAILLLSPRGAVLVPSLAGRVLMAAYYIGEPNSSEVYVNVTNAMWHLALVGFLIVLLPKPRTVFGFVTDTVTLVLAGLSGPIILFVAPIAWWHVIEQRHQRSFRPCVIYAAIASACALIQTGFILTSAHQARHGALGATLNRLFHIIADQVILGGLIGGPNTIGLLQIHFWARTLWPALVCMGAAILGVVAFVRGPSVYRQFVVLAGLILVTSLASPMVSYSVPQWEPMQYPGAGDRYFIIPMLAWFSTLLVAAEKPWGGIGHWIARLLLVTSLTGISHDWHYNPYTDTSYQDAAKAFDEAPAGTVITFPENPLTWNFKLTKH